MQTHLNGFGCELMHGYCCAFCKLSVLHMLFPALFRVHMALTTDSPEASRLRNMCCSTFPATSGLSYSVLRLEAKDRPPHMVKQCPNLHRTAPDRAGTRPIPRMKTLALIAICIRPQPSKSQPSAPGLLTFARVSYRKPNPEAVHLKDSFCNRSVGQPEVDVQ